MPKLPDLFITQESLPIRVGNQSITLISKALRWAPPLGFGGLIWNRPLAVRVRSANGVEHLLPVVDETRRQQLLILALGLAASLLIALLMPRKTQ